MAEFAHAGDEQEALLVVAVLQHAVEALEAIQDLAHVLVGDVVEDGLVVLVNEDDDLSALGQLVDQLREAEPRGLLRQGNRMLFSQRPHLAHEVSGQLPEGVRDDAVVPEAQMDDGIDLPVVGLVIERQALEQVLLPLEDGLQGRNQQRLAKAPRARQKISRVAWPNEVPDILRFVHIQEISLDQFLKIE